MGIEDVHIVTLKAFHIVGPTVTIKIGENKIPELWNLFERRCGEIVA